MLKLVDRHGRPLAASDTVHHGASLTARDMAAWVPLGGSADADILPELDTLTARARDLEQNSGIAAGSPQLFVDHVIGPQLKLSVMPDWRTLGRSQEWAMEWADTVERLWRPYAQSCFFDAQEQVNFTGMAGLVLRGRQSSGGHIVLPMWLPSRPGAKYGTAFMAIEIDRLSNPYGQPDSKTLRGGIEYNSRGAPQAYHIRNGHPGDRWGWVASDATWTRIPARALWGRPRVLHCFHKTRSGQSRGTPALTSVLGDFKALSRYRHAELQAAVANAMVTYFVESQMGFDAIAAMFGRSEDYLDSRASYNSTVRKIIRGITMDENIIVPIFPGDRVESPKQSRPNSEFDNFSNGILRHIAAALGISYESLLRDFSKTNYSSARAALLMDWKTFLGMREWLITYYAKPVYHLWLEEIVNRGMVEAPDFYENLDAYAVCKFTGAGKGLIDPTKETRASRDRIQMGISTLEDEATEQGKDYQEVMVQRAREIREAFDLARQSGLPEVAGYVLAGLPVGSDVTPEPTQEETGENADT